MISGFIVKIVLLVALPILVVAGLLIAIPHVLSIDDLAGCSGPQETDQKCASADAIVAISGGDTEARAREAIALYKNGWAPVIIFSGAAQDKAGSSNAAVMAAQAVAARVPQGAIMLDEVSINTADNASQVRDIALSHGFKRIILVTSPYHQRRASIEFSRRLGDVATIINHPTTTDRFWRADSWWATPWGLWLGGTELVKVLFVSISR